MRQSLAISIPAGLLALLVMAVDADAAAGCGRCGGGTYTATGASHQAATQGTFTSGTAPVYAYGSGSGPAPAYAYAPAPRVSGYAPGYVGSTTAGQMPSAGRRIFRRR